MSRRFIQQLTDREQVDGVFLVADRQLRTNRQGGLYLQMRLSDRTGSVTGMMWNANEKQYHAFENGDYLRVQGTAQLYNGALQIIVTRIDRTPASEVDESDFVTLGTAEVDRLATRVSELLRGMKNYPLRNLADCFLMDEPFMAGFTAAPAGIKNHHAYRGGLLDHVVSLMELTAVVAPRYPEIDPDLLLMGAFLHDVGKTRELTYERDLAYSDEGQLIGHLVIGVGMLDEKIREAEKRSGEPFPEELRLRLQHMILSHHGEYEFGSPKLPMTLEAIALHFLDNLDSKIHGISGMMREDANDGSPWTPYQASLGRKLFKGRRVEDRVD
ncbi:MAG: HD domain-containing protein [Candidatus Anammoximicrobium sp.]|nr:HD domain-containing protein [Candidatus Anammoximicrobium sp.]